MLPLFVVIFDTTSNAEWHDHREIDKAFAYDRSTRTAQVPRLFLVSRASLHGIAVRPPSCN